MSCQAGFRGQTGRGGSGVDCHLGATHGRLGLGTELVEGSAGDDDGDGDGRVEGETMAVGKSPPARLIRCPKLIGRRQVHPDRVIVSTQYRRRDHWV